MDAWIVNVLPNQKGTKYPIRYINYECDIDSRASELWIFTTMRQGAYDNASGNGRNYLKSLPRDCSKISF